jgi:hypothetical protein
VTLEEVVVGQILLQGLQLGYRFHVMSVIRLFVRHVIGVMNIKPIMRFGFVIDVMRFIVRTAMKWINVRIVGKWYVRDVGHCAVVNFVDVVYVKIVRQLVGGEYVYVCV